MTSKRKRKTAKQRMQPVYTVPQNGYMTAPAYMYPPASYTNSGNWYYPADQYGNQIGPPVQFPPIVNPHSYDQPSYSYPDYMPNIPTHVPFVYPPQNHSSIPHENDHYHHQEKLKNPKLPPIEKQPLKSARTSSPNHDDGYQRFNVHVLPDNSSELSYPSN